MSWDALFRDRAVVHRSDLLGLGATGRMITAAVRNNYLVRIRRDHYALPGTALPLMQAVRVGGLMGCVTALASWGVFTMEQFPHVHLDRAMSRMRSPNFRHVPFRLAEDGAVLHWWPLTHPEAATESRVGIADALAQAIRCQPRHLAIAAIDSALHLGAIGEASLAEIFRSVPARYRRWAALVDGRAESGAETVLRLIVHDAGYRYRVQVPFGDGFRRMDLLVEDRLVLEADSRLAHEGWDRHVSDRSRDIEHAEHGRPTLRPVFQHILFEPDRTRRAIRGILGPPRRR